MTYIGCSLPERFVNPLFEVFDGGDFVLSSSRDIEEDFTRLRIYLEDAFEKGDARRRLEDALAIVGAAPQIEEGEIADEDWKFAYRRHFKTELVSERIYTIPEWEWDSSPVRGEPGKVCLKLDPGMAFGTGKHETTKACLQYIDEILRSSASDPRPPSFLDMGTGSGILAIAAAKLGCREVRGFDVDQEAVDAANENAAMNGVEIPFFRYGLGAKARRDLGSADLVVANILGPLLIRFADEIVPTVRRHLVLSGILTELYPEVIAAYEQRGLREVSRKTIGEWTTGLLVL